MSLFNFDTPEATTSGTALHLSIEASKLLDKNALLFLEQADWKSGIFISDAKFSSYQMLNSLLDKFGPSNVWITSYGISETVMRHIATRKQSGLIQDLHFIFSDHVKRIKPAEMQIAESIATTFCHYPCHAKIIVIQNQTHSAVIVSSMNMNRNNKLEAGFIGYDRSIAQNLITYLTQIWNSTRNN